MADLDDLAVGPVLRGLSAAYAAGGAGLLSVTGAAGGEAAALAKRGVSSVGPGARFQYRDVGSAGADGTVPVLTLETPVDAGGVAAAWSRFITEHGAAPGKVRLPSGAAWIQTAPPPGSAATDTSQGDRAGDRLTSGDLLTPGDIGNSVAGRVAIVTGAAQGFGLQIARGLASLGAVVALADMNIDGAREQAELLGDPHRAFAVNVTDEESVKALVDAVTREYGGFDLVVSNAGVLKAGSVKDLALKDFRFVTDVNYIGFFLMTKHTAPVLELQNRGAVALQEVAVQGSVAARPVPYLTDIVEINSKSGLVGSNRNAAYAGSKFGGIGLVQSFALELVEQGTKVNAICPGNYLDGPLWSDPERGLFVQYLRAGKVPGATTIEEVRRFYEDKVPMKRGCTGSDVVRAVAYVVGQPYETGQAVPVTGGQVMLA